jgi:hypothetical protein
MSSQNLMPCIFAWNAGPSRRRRLSPTDQCLPELSDTDQKQQGSEEDHTGSRPATPRTCSVESSEEEAAPRAELVPAQRCVSEPRRPVCVDHEHAPPGRVDDEPERDPPRHLRVRHDHPLLAPRAAGAVPVHLRHAAAEEGGRQEPRALVVPLGALVEPAVARIRDPAGSALQERDHRGSRKGQGGEHGPTAPAAADARAPDGAALTAAAAPAAHREMRWLAGDDPVAWPGAGGRGFRLT